MPVTIATISRIFAIHDDRHDFLFPHPPSAPCPASVVPPRSVLSFASASTREGKEEEEKRGGALREYLLRGSNPRPLDVSLLPPPRTGPEGETSVEPESYRNR